MSSSSTGRGNCFSPLLAAQVGEVADASDVKDVWLNGPDPRQHGVVTALHYATVVGRKRDDVSPWNFSSTETSSNRIPLILKRVQTLHIIHSLTQKHNNKNVTPLWRKLIILHLH